MTIQVVKTVARIATNPSQSCYNVCIGNGAKRFNSMRQQAEKEVVAYMGALQEYAPPGLREELNTGFNHITRSFMPSCRV